MTNSYRFAQAALKANGSLETVCIQLNRGDWFNNVQPGSQLWVRLTPITGDALTNAVMVGFYTNSSTTSSRATSIDGEWYSWYSWQGDENGVQFDRRNIFNGKKGSFKIEFYVEPPQNV